MAFIYLSSQVVELETPWVALDLTLLPVLQAVKGTDARAAVADPHRPATSETQGLGRPTMLPAFTTQGRGVAGATLMTWQGAFCSASTIRRIADAAATQIAGAAEHRSVEQSSGGFPPG